jgi:hypothetical protein
MSYTFGVVFFFFFGFCGFGFAGMKAKAASVVLG